MCGFRKLKKWLCCCIGSGNDDESKIYLPGFLNRPAAVITSHDLAYLPLRQQSVQNQITLSIACVERGEICTGLGYIAELVRYPPSGRRPHWTVSYSVWVSRNQAANRLLWRAFFSDIVAFFYVIDATDRARIDMARAEIEKFISPVQFPSFIALIFLNNSIGKESMSVVEVDKVLGIAGPNCLAYLIQPIRPHSKNTFKRGLGWLYDRLLETASTAPPIFPAETPGRSQRNPNTTMDRLPLAERVLDLQHDDSRRPSSGASNDSQPFYRQISPKDATFKPSRLSRIDEDDDETTNEGDGKLRSKESR